MALRPRTGALIRRAGVRIEDLVVVTDGGREILTQTAKDLVSVD